MYCWTQLVSNYKQKQISNKYQTNNKQEQNEYKWKNTIEKKNQRIM